MFGDTKSIALFALKFSKTTLSLDTFVEVLANCE